MVQSSDNTFFNNVLYFGLLIVLTKSSQRIMQYIFTGSIVGIVYYFIASIGRKSSCRVHVLNIYIYIFFNINTICTFYVSAIYLFREILLLVSCNTSLGVYIIYGSVYQ